METAEAIRLAHAAHLRFMNGSFVSSVEKTEFGTLVFSDLIADSYWSYFLPRPGLGEGSDACIEETVLRFKERGRNPCFLVDPKTNSHLSSALAAAGFERGYEDVWMFYEGGLPALPRDPAVEIAACASQKDFEIFLEIFSLAYAGSSPDEPYGALPPEYAKAFQVSFDRRAGNGLQHFILSYKGRPAGIGMLGLSADAACLYALGIRPELRKRGLAEHMTAHRLKVALGAKSPLIFLQTETASYNEKLFSKYGFSAAARSAAYVLKVFESSRG